MAYANLNNEKVEVNTELDSIVIVDVLQTIRGGRTLDVSGFALPVIQAGHPIIKETSTGELKPLPVSGSGAILNFGTLTPGANYAADDTYSDVALTGGSGSGAKANITVVGGKVTNVDLTVAGTGYAADDSLSAAAASIGGTGTGFAIKVASADTLASAYGSLPSGHTYEGVLINSILTTKPFAGVLVRGTVNPKAAQFSYDSILSAIKTALPLIDFRED